MGRTKTNGSKNLDSESRLPEKKSEHNTKRKVKDWWGEVGRKDNTPGITIGVEERV